ncbi:MAG: tetratricopeptide repeat protein [Myxococcota bacterium]
MDDDFGFHLEALRDRELSGTLSPSEERALDAHVASCPACQAERRLYDAAAAENDLDLDTLFEKVERARSAESEPRRPSPQRLPHWTRAAVLLLAFAAAGVVFAATLGPRIFRQDPPEPQPSAPVPPVPSSPIEVPAEEPLEEEPVEEPVEETTQVNRAEAAMRSRPRPAQREEPAEAAPTARTLFVEASAARRQGERARAVAAYEDLLRLFPDSSRAPAAHYALGELQRRAAPAEALSHYNAYLRSGQRALREEALLGRARTLRRMGRPGDARRAFETLLREYPNTPHRTEAERRTP